MLPIQNNKYGGTVMPVIKRVEIYLDYPENSPGSYHIHSVISYDSECEGNEIEDYQTIAYKNTYYGDYASDAKQQMIVDVAAELGVSTDKIQIMN